MARSTSSGGKKGRREKEGAVIKVELTQEETEAVIKACRKYRQTIPIYIESQRGEVVLIDSVLSKLMKK